MVIFFKRTWSNQPWFLSRAFLALIASCCCQCVHCFRWPVEDRSSAFFCPSAVAEEVRRPWPSSPSFMLQPLDQKQLVASLVEAGELRCLADVKPLCSYVNSGDYLRCRCLMKTPPRRDRMASICHSRRDAAGIGSCRRILHRSRRLRWDSCSDADRVHNCTPKGRVFYTSVFQYNACWLLLVVLLTNFVSNSLQSMPIDLQVCLWANCTVASVLFTWYW